MLKKTIPYTDYEGVDRVEDFYFNINKAELSEMQLSQPGGFVKMIQKISAEQDGPKIVQLFKDLVLNSYGEKSPDGKRFIKEPERTKAFSQTEAYVNLYMEISNDAKAASAFVKGILPKDLVDQAELDDPTLKLM